MIKVEIIRNRIEFRDVIEEIGTKDRIIVRNKNYLW